MDDIEFIVNDEPLHAKIVKRVVFEDQVTDSQVSAERDGVRYVLEIGGPDFDYIAVKVIKRNFALNPNRPGEFGAMMERVNA